jgi:anti-anti-sigma factor
MTAEMGSSIEEVAPLKSPLEISVNHGEKRTHVIAQGELDRTTCPFLRQTLVELERDLEGDLVLDIGQVPAIDSVGLSVLILMHKKLQTQGRNLIVSSPTPEARRLFDVTRLSEVLWIEPFERRRRPGR